MKTTIKIIEISSLTDYQNPNYLDFYNPEDVAFISMALNGISAKYDVVGFIDPYLNGGQVTVRFFIEPVENMISQGYRLQSMYEFMKVIIKKDEPKRTEFQSYVDDVSDLFNLGGGFEEEDFDIVYEIEINKEG